MKNKHEYIGWVPCISGKLFFEFSDCGLNDDTIEININHLDSNAGNVIRYVVMSSTVKWEDQHKDKYDGLFRVLLIASTTNDNYLSGNIIITTEKNASEKWHHIDASLRKMIQCTINEQILPIQFF